ncbi:MAG: tetratricopeptide repeat protein, partial [Candidatus Thermoplasmatota archaeon]
MVAKNNGILILPIKLVAFSQKEIWLLSQHFKIYKPREIPQTEINYTNILRNITPKCFFDIRTIFEPTKYVDYSERRPKIRFFSGRKKELKEIKDFLKSKSKILCVKGIAGIGKTTLVSKFIETVEMDIFWHRFSQFSTLRGLLTKFSEFLAKMDRRKLENYLEKERFELDEILIILEEELREANTLLIFDDFHKVNGEVVDFFAYLKNLEMDAKIIIMGREIPLFYDRRDVIIKKNIREIVLGGLDRESSIRLLKHRKIEKRLDEMYLATKGHPLLLELITPETETDVEKFIKEEIMNGLEYKEIKALEIASVFRCPFPGKAIMDDINYDILDNLVNKSLMQKYDWIYDLHDLIREFIYGRMTKKQKIENHKIAAEYYENEKGEGAIIEAIYHHIKAMRQKDAVKIAIENGTNLINKGFWKEFENVLGGISEEHAAVEHYTKLLSFKSDIYFRIGKWDTAITCIQQTIRLCKEINDKKQLAENYCKLGELLMNRGENENAKENIQKALNVFKDLNDAYGLARAHYCLGRVYWHIRELDDALMHLNSALSISEQINDQTLIAKCIMDIGNVYNLKGDYP